MKKLLILTLVALMVMGLSAFAAGPYFILENDTSAGLLLAPSLTVGCDWETVIGAVSGPSFGGDFSLGFANILEEPAVDTPWTLILDTNIDWGAVQVSFRSLVEIISEDWPDRIEITDASNIELKITGEPGNIVGVWGGVRLEYANNAAWKPVLFFGIEVHLDLVGSSPF